jgi:hypothetical protein
MVGDAVQRDRDDGEDPEHERGARRQQPSGKNEAPARRELLDDRWLGRRGRVDGCQGVERRRLPQAGRARRRMDGDVAGQGRTLTGDEPAPERVVLIHQPIVCRPISLSRSASGPATASSGAAWT